MGIEQDIFDLVQESVVLRNQAGRIVEWNAASERLYGWSREETKGRPIHELLKTTQEAAALMESALRADGAWVGDVTRTTASGTPIIVKLKCVLRRAANGETADIVETGVDVTEQRRAAEAKTALETSEERYRSLFHFLPVALVRLDRAELAGVFAALHAQGVRDLRRYFDTHPGFYEYAADSIQVAEVNHRTVELFAARDASQLLGPAARLWSEGRETIQQSMAARFQGAPGFEAEMKIKTFRFRDVLYVAYFPEAFSDDALGLSCLVDIGDRVAAQAALAQVQAEFAHAARVSMLGELTASIAHEVNQPLGAILTNGEAALRWLNRPEPDLAELRMLSTHTIADARRAADIISRIRSMATHGKPQETRLGLNDVVQEVLLFLRPELKRQGVNATLDLAPNLPDVLADRVQLQQVFANLAVNAMQAMAQQDERRLTIRTARVDDRTLRADIEDTGHGIAADHRDRLFQSFFTTKNGGMGIGLAICRSIIEAYGGRIEAANLPDGPGARVGFTLPVSAH
jgi:PAS domain S-box-containing protein